MKSLFRSGKSWLWAGLVLFIALIIFMPLAGAAQLLGLKDMGVTARSLRGPVWWGGAEELAVGGVHLGTVDVFLDPLTLLTGQARVDIARINQKPDDIVGAIRIGFGVHGLDDVSGDVALAAALAPLPVSKVGFDKFTVRFVGEMCSVAEGRVQVQLSSMAAGPDLSRGMGGEARCDGPNVMIPLVSQSGQERIDLRVKADGSYVAEMRVRTSDAALGAALVANGFSQADGAFMLRAVGAL